MLPSPDSSVAAGAQLQARARARMWAVRAATAPCLIPRGIIAAGTRANRAGKSASAEQGAAVKERLNFYGRYFY